MRIRSTKGEADMGIKQRLERLEAGMGLKNEPRVTIITIDPDGISKEGPYSVEIFPDLWAYAIRGGPFTNEKIRQLREDNKREWEKWQERMHEHARAKG